MKTELKDVIHFYLGCECLNGSNQLYTLKPSHIPSNHFDVKTNHRLVLRLLSDMTEEEEEEIGINKTYHIDVNCENKDSFYFHPNEFKYLLKQGFDLFGLLESGQAIDKTTLKL